MRATTVLLCTALGGCSSEIGTGERGQEVDSSDPAVLERAAIREWVAGREDTLGSIDRGIEAAVREGYSATLLTEEGHARVVRTALIEWTHLVRQHLTEPLHTKVPALVDDPECRGSVAGDGLLLSYVEAITNDEARQVDHVVLPLRELARQMACLGEEQSTHLATMMVSAFDDVRITLRANQLDAAIPYVVQAVSMPMILVHEAERHHGPTSPLARWFADYEVALLDGAASQHQPATWHGLWLYDRMTGRLRGFRATREPVDENDIDLAALIRTIAHPTIDDPKCSYAEMVQRGAYAGRYHCLGSQCAASSDPICRLPSGASETRPEEGAMNTPAIATDSVVTCISNQVASPLGEEMACVVEATGKRATPTELLSKGQVKTTMVGIKGGGSCQLSATMADAYDQYDKDVQAAWDKANKRIDVAVKELHEAIELYKAAQVRLDEKTLDLNRTDPKDAAATAAAIKARDDADAWAGIKKQDINSKQSQLAKETTDAAKVRDDEVKAAEAKKKAAMPTRCPKGTDCGNACSTLSAQAQSTLDCVTGGRTQNRDPINGPGGCHGTCDPIDPDDSRTGSMCISELAQTPGSALAEKCWAVRCGPSALAAGGACCGGPGAGYTTPSMPSLCTQARCTDSAEVYSDLKCSCGGSSTGGVPGSPPVSSHQPVPTFPLY